MTYNAREFYISNLFRIVTILLCVYIITTSNHVNSQMVRLTSQIEVIITSLYGARAEVKEVTKKMVIFDRKMTDLEKRMIRLEIELERVN